MKKYLFVLSALVLLTFISCRKIAGEPITRYFSVDGTYTELQVEDAFDVIVSDTATLITITAGEYIMPNVVVETVDNTLKIYLKGWHTNRGTDMTVIMPYNADLKKVDLSGASEFHSEYGLYGEQIEVELSGASEFYCDIEANEIDMSLSGASNAEGTIDASALDLDMSGASDATLDGLVTTLDLDLSGASSIKKTINGSNYGFECDVCKGEMSGASNAYIHCDGTIKVSLSGASDLHFTGTAFTGDSSTSGASDIIHDELP